MLNDDQLLAARQKFWAERRAKKAHMDEFLGYGHERRAAQVRRVLTGRPIVEALQSAYGAVASTLKSATGFANDFLAGFPFAKKDAGYVDAEPMETVRAPRRNLSPEAFAAEFEAELNRLNPGRNTILDLNVGNVPAVYARAGREVVRNERENALAAAYAGNNLAEIIDRAALGFPQGDFVDLLRTLDRRENEALATEVFVRLTAQFVLSELAEHEPDASNLARTALALKDYFPQLGSAEIFNELETRLADFTGKSREEIRGVLETVRESHVLEAYHAASVAPLQPPVVDAGLVAAGSDEALARLAEGFDNLAAMGEEPYAAPTAPEGPRTSPPAKPAAKAG